MTANLEKRLLQAAIVVAGAFSLFFAAISVIDGVRVLLPGYARANIDLDSHFRYLSGIFFGVIVALYSCVADIERKGPRFRLLGALIVCGGLARLIGLLSNGVPGAGHLGGLGLELVVTPLLLLWQARVAQRFARPPGS